MYPITQVPLLPLLFCRLGGEQCIGFGLGIGGVGGNFQNRSASETFDKYDT